MKPALLALQPKSLSKTVVRIFPFARPSIPPRPKPYIICLPAPR